MDNKSALQHDTALEHALDVAKANHKEAIRLLDEARAAFKAGDISQDRVNQLEELLDLAADDLKRVIREQ